MKSIMQNSQDYCYLCALLHMDYGKKPTEEHHAVFGTAGRSLSEKYGLKIRLCVAHHREGPEAVHQNVLMARLVKQEAQKAFEREHSRVEWMKIFGRSYL